jgi:hypothetical protein
MEIDDLVDLAPASQSNKKTQQSAHIRIIDDSENNPPPFVVVIQGSKEVRYIF